jgi:hypothetical protein
MPCAEDQDPVGPDSAEHGGYRGGSTARSTVRAVLNRTFFDPAMCRCREGYRVQLREPFDILNEAYRLYRTPRPDLPPAAPGTP